jgi:nitrilase
MNPPDTINPFKVAVIQQSPIFLNIEESVEKEVIEGFHSLGQPDNGALKLLEAMPGEKGDLILRGGSVVIAPNSEYLEGPVYDESRIIYAGIEPGRIAEGHLFLDTQGHYSRPDVFHLEVNDLPQSNMNFKSQSE